MTNDLWHAPPCLYFAVAALFVAFHVGRGMIGQTYLNPSNPRNPNYPYEKKIRAPKCWQTMWLFYVNDALLHICCTVFGFVCLWFAYLLVGAAGASTFGAGLVFLALVGLAGITGQL